MSESDATKNEQTADAETAAGDDHADKLTAPKESASDDIGQSTSGATGGGDAEPEPPPKTTLSMTIDDRSWEAQPGQLVIDACEKAGVYVPRFCYHPRMTPVGMCRQCIVEIEGPRGPMIAVSCMTPVADGQVVHTANDVVKRAQEGVLELLLANHPLDCPVCDKGGECPLQDQALSHGPGESRYVEEKRHFEKPIPISDLVLLDRERCVLCDRCTRFAHEVAGDPLIAFTHRGNETQVLTFPDEPFASYFSGNTVQICPVGALTAKPYRFKARPWDLEQVESTCTTCSVGCRMVVQSSRDTLVRYTGVDSDPVNWSWLCDLGRFNFESVNSGERLGAPMVRGEGGLAETSWNVALDVSAQLFVDATRSAGPRGIAILGGARGTNEDAYAWARLADQLRIADRDAQIGDGMPPALLDLPRATIDEAASASTIVLLGPDLKEELPVRYLRLRDAAEKRRSRILEFAPTATGLTRYAWRSVRVAAGSRAPLSAALAEAAVREQLAAGPVVIVGGRANLAESAESAM
jgi:NADH-quinone oxidoreductase subunit G